MVMVRPVIAISIMVVAMAMISLVMKGAAAIEIPAMVHLDPAALSYRPAGDFRIGNRMVTAPARSSAVNALEIMKYQVSQADYARCMAAAACPRVLTAGLITFAQTGPLRKRRGERSL